MLDRLMTYEELAAALGRSPEAVRQLVKRKRWRRVISNDDGKARITVPVDYLEANPPDDPRPAGPTTPERPAVEPPAVPPATPQEPSADARTLMAFLQERIGELRDRAAELEGELRTARGTIADLTTDKARTHALLEAAQARADELRTERDRLLDRLTAPAPAPPPGLLSRLRRAFG